MNADALVHAREGDDHIFTWAELGYEARVETIRRNVHGLYGELSISTSRTLSDGGSSGHLYFDTLNLAKNEEKVRAAKALAGLTDHLGTIVPWERMLEAIRYIVREEFRRGAPFVRLSDVKSAPMRWFFDRVAPFGDPTTVFAAGGTGKSTVTAQAAVAAALGKRIGVFSPTVGPTPVLVLDWETTEQEWSRRVEAIARATGVPTPENIIYQPQSAAFVDSVGAVRKKVRDDGIGIVIVDSLMGAYGGAIVPELTTPFFNALRSLPATPLIVHHLTKSDAKESNGPPDMYGDVTITNRTRAAWALKRTDSGEDGAMELVMTNTKMNGARLQRSIGFRLVHVDEDGPEYEIRHEQFDPLGANTISTNLRLGDRILAELRRQNASHKELADTLSVAEITVRRTLYRMKERKLVESVTDGNGPASVTTWALRVANDAW